MTNIKNITKKLVNLGFSENKLMMMTEKEIREAYKVAKEESTMKNNTNTTATNNSTTVVKEEITMRELVNNTINRITTATKVQDAEYVTRDELAGIMEQLTGVRPGKKVTRKQMVQDLYVLEDDLQQMENANGSDCDSDTVVAVGDFCNDHALESIESDPTSVVENPAPVSDAKVLTYKLMHKIGDHALINRKKGFGTTISAKMLCAFIVEIASLNDPEPIDRLYVSTGKKDKYGRNITMVNPKITEEHKNKCKDVRKWLLDNRYIKTVTFKDEKGFVFYTPEYDGNIKDRMYDATKFQPTGKIETTTYKVTKEMNKWYTK